MLQDLDVDNVFIYIADAVRWDFVPDSIMNNGIGVKTIAGGIHSPTSIASIASGTYLPQHNVAQFTDALPNDVPNLLDASLSTAFINSINDVRFEPSEHSLIANTLNTSVQSPDILSSIEPSFFILERGPGGHAPYGDFNGDGWEYFEARGASPREQFASEYRRAVEKDKQWFEKRVETLEERGLLDDTLVIYTSDHGELLGEAGMLGHSPPIHPRHVYVPTVFMHPEIGQKTITNRVLRHMDLAPTIASLLEIELTSPIKPIGRDLTKESLADHGESFHTMKKSTPLGEYEVSYESSWSSNGGHVFPKSSRKHRVPLALYQLARVPWRKHAQQNVRQYLQSHLQNSRVHWAPEMSPQEAKQNIDNVKKKGATQNRRQAEDVAKESLRNLGYIE
ncbi:sulfatase-like hydrolase/transferase [Haladaptatus caseinilyticus]|uniref:sulfatase-like hydrolase/transferase n=1 Tax=Haladaptatus caseinilyticus TaxID=2993314 RepID=UPI00224A55D9|nr:sulfatase-like hydrolase/transferase [Haladaptatus caseinilyticus]